MLVLICWSPREARRKASEKICDRRTRQTKSIYLFRQKYTSDDVDDYGEKVGDEDEDLAPTEEIAETGLELASGPGLEGYLLME